jgi:spermidine synthase
VRAGRIAAAVARDDADAQPPAALPTTSRAGRAAPSRARHGLLLGMAAASGALALVYEVLWRHQLVTLLGNDVRAAAATLATFFAGLAAGAWFWGTRCARLGNTLRAYAALELGAAAGALLHLGVLAVLREAAAGSPDAAADAIPPAAVAAALSTLLLGATAFLLGGTLPLLVEPMAEDRALGAATSLVVAFNTIGAAAGALAAGFWLPEALGLRRSTLAATSASLALAGVAWMLARRGHCDSRPRPASVVDTEGIADTRRPLLVAVAFWSGFAVLGLEVAWSRLFALVLHNSAYSFAAILVVVLLGLALGAAVALVLCRRGRATRGALVVLLLLAGVTVGGGPLLLHRLSDGFGYLRAGDGFPGYLLAVVQRVALVMLVPAAVCGTILPLLARLAESQPGAHGERLGRLLAANTAGGVAGALLTGLLLLPALGVLGALRAIAVAYLLLALVLATRWQQPRSAVAAAGVLLLLVTALDPARLETVRLDVERGESLHRKWDTPYGVVAVVARPGDLRIELDNSYTLGGTASHDYEAAQADLPLLLAGRPRSAFFLGVGTGITAAAALRHPLERVTSVELIPEVAEAARVYFAEHASALFTDPRSRVVIGDGRAVLAAEGHTYDVVVADLFVPWHAGTASLYTREHYATVRARLAPHGLFAQWLPLYQMSRREFDVVVRTMLDVFPQVTLWRGDFLPKNPIVAVVGQEAGAHLDPATVLAAVRALGRHADRSDRGVVALASLFYAGNLSAIRDRFAHAPANTDDRPLLEYLAARTQAEVAAKRTRWFVGDELDGFYAELATSAGADPYLALLDDEQRGFVAGGRALYGALAAAARGDGAAARALRDEFRDLVPYGVYEMFRARLARADRLP